MPKPPKNWHLCSWCKRVVSVVEDGQVVREMALSETKYTVKDFDRPGGGHGICSVCDTEQRKLMAKMKAKHRSAKGVRDNPPAWAVDRGTWREAVDVTRASYPTRAGSVPREFFAVVAQVYKQMGGRIKRKARGNPSGAEWNAIVSLWSDFHGRMPNAVVKISDGRQSMPAVVAGLGRLLSLTYESDKFDGRKRRYRHTFDKPPDLVADHTGQLWIVGGKYKVTERGIEG